MQRPHASRNTTRRDSYALDEHHPVMLNRIETARTQHTLTVGAASTYDAQLHRVSTIGAGKQFPDPITEDYVVEWDGPEDEEHPENWPLVRKVTISTTLGFVTLVVTLGSSIFSPAVADVARHFDLSNIVGVLGISLYVLGFATGPMLWGPLSELHGRRLPILVAPLGFSVFTISAAVSKDLQTLMICRFFAGFCGGCHLTVVGAVLSDMFNHSQRGLAVATFSTTVLSGPLIAPFIGGFIVMNESLGWRWTQHTTGILGFAGLVMGVVFLEETFPPIILAEKAGRLRRTTRNWAIHARQEEVEIEMSEIIRRNFLRPIRMLFTEPIVLALSVYMAFIYGLLYLFLTFYPIVFQELHGMDRGVGGLPYLGMLIGLLLAGVSIALETPCYNRKLRANHDEPVPEWRLPMAIIGGLIFAVGIFWFGWSGFDNDVHWMVPTASGIFTGFGLLAVFLPCFNYLVDSYLNFSASAIAANTLLRSICGAVFPLFARYFIKGLGVQWAGTLLGCVALAMVPVPFLLWRYGESIRVKSRLTGT